MFKWPVVLLLFGIVLCVNSQTQKRAEKRVINDAGMDYAFQQQLPRSEPSQGLSAYSNFPQKMPEQQGEMPKHVKTIIVTKKVPVPYPVHVEKKVPVPVKVPIRRPYTVFVPKPYYVEVMKQVPVPFKVPVPQPYTVEKHVPFPYKVHYDKPFPVHISKPYPVYYEKRVPIHVEKPIAVPYRVQVDRPMPVHFPIERPMYFPVERPYPFPVRVPVEKPMGSHVHRVPVTVEKPQLASSEHSQLHDYYTSTQPTVHNTFSPSPYDELTSTMLTEGKHKVISFLPGSQDTFGSYGSSSADIGTIHVSNIKGNGGNSTDWVPKTTPNNQYLTYIPNHQPKFLNYYTVPEKATKLQEVSNAEPYVVKHGSVKMHYKLHYDPAKQEYSFQLAPKTPSSHYEQNAVYSYQAVNSESNHNQNPPSPQYVYKTPEGQNSDSSHQYSTKPSGDEQPYSYQHLYQGKPDVNSAQQSSDSSNLMYHPTQNQQQSQYKHEVPYAFQTIDPGRKATYDSNSQIPGQTPEVTYSYQPSQTVDSEPQHLSPEQHQVAYSYQSVGDDSKHQQLSSDAHQVTYMYHNADPPKNSEIYPSEHVSYLYIPPSSASQPHSNAEAQYSVSSEHNVLSTEYPEILYQQGRTATILREQYVTPVPATAGGRIPESTKSSRTSESLYPLHENHTRDASRDSNDNDDQQVNEISSTSTGDKYHINDLFSTSYNQTNDDLPSSSIRFEKFGVADVMSGRRTKLYPVTDSSDSQLHRNVENREPSSSTSAYELAIPLENYFGGSETPRDVTDGPFSAKVNRLSSYKVSRSRRLTRTKLKKINDFAGIQDQAVREEENTDKPTALSSIERYEFFGFNESDLLKNSAKETNSHTGAAERAPFYRISTTTTTTSSSLQPPDATVTIKPTQPLRTRSRGSVRAYTKRKEESSTEGISTSSTEGSSTTASTRARRRRRPARRRMDKVTESPVEPVE